MENEAASIATDETPSERMEWVDSLEERRDDLGVTMPRIDEILGKPDNWYSNRVRGGEHSHDFSLLSYHEVSTLLDTSLYDGDVDVDSVRERARSRKNRDVRRLEDIRTVVGVDESDIDGVLDRYRGWYSDHRDDSEKEFPLTAYIKARIFIETVLQFKYLRGEVSEDTAGYLQERGIIDPDVLAA